MARRTVSDLVSPSTTAIEKGQLGEVSESESEVEGDGEESEGESQEEAVEMEEGEFLETVVSHYSTFTT